MTGPMPAWALNAAGRLGARLPLWLRLALLPAIIPLAFAVALVTSFRPAGFVVLLGDGTKRDLPWTELRTWPSGPQPFEAELDRWRAR